MAKFNQQGFVDAVQKAMEAEIGRIADEEIKLALSRAEDRISEKLGNIALRILREYDLKMDGDRVIITVKNHAA